MPWISGCTRLLACGPIRCAPSKQPGARVGEHLHEVTGVLHRPAVRGVAVVGPADDVRRSPASIACRSVSPTDGHLWFGEHRLRDVAVVAADHGVGVQQVVLDHPRLVVGDVLQHPVRADVAEREDAVGTGALHARRRPRTRRRRRRRRRGRDRAGRRWDARPVATSRTSTSSSPGDAATDGGRDPPPGLGRHPIERGVEPDVQPRAHQLGEPLRQSRVGVAEQPLRAVDDRDAGAEARRTRARTRPRRTRHRGSASSPADRCQPHHGVGGVERRPRTSPGMSGTTTRLPAAMTIWSAVIVSLPQLQPARTGEARLVGEHGDVGVLAPATFADLGGVAIDPAEDPVADAPASRPSAGSNRRPSRSACSGVRARSAG